MPLRNIERYDVGPWNSEVPSQRYVIPKSQEPLIKKKTNRLTNRGTLPVRVSESLVVLGTILRTLEPSCLPQNLKCQSATAFDKMMSVLQRTSCSAVMETCEVNGWWFRALLSTATLVHGSLKGS